MAIHWQICTSKVGFETDHDLGESFGGIEAAGGLVVGDDSRAKGFGSMVAGPGTGGLQEFGADALSAVGPIDEELAHVDIRPLDQDRKAFGLLPMQFHKPDDPHLIYGNENRGIGR